MRVIGKVRWHPIEDHANAVLVQGVNEIHKILRRAIAPCGSKEAGDLVAPGPIEGMLHDGQEFDMRKSQALHVLGQPGGQLAIAEGTVVLLRHPAPGTQVHLVNRHGGGERMALGALGHPRLVAPVVPEFPHD